MIKLGISGCRRGNSFLEAAGLAGFDVYALIDPDPKALEMLGEKAGVPQERRFQNFAEIIDSGIDAVLVSSPMPVHSPQAIMALENDIHVLSEVTAAVSFSQCKRLRDAARNSKATYMMAENYTYMKANQLVKAMVRKGLFGEIYYAEGQYLHNVRDLGVLSDGSHTWRQHWQLSRRGLTYPTHSIGPVLQWLDDRVVSLTAQGSGTHTDKEKFSGDDTAVMLGTTSKGALVNIRTDLHSQRPHNMAYYQLQGTKGCYEAPRGLGDDHKIWLEDKFSDDEVHTNMWGVKHPEINWHSLWEYEEDYLPEVWKVNEEKAKKAGHGGGDLIELFDWVKAIKGEGEPPIDVYTALDWTLTALVSELAVEAGGETLPVPDPSTEELDEASEREEASGRFKDFKESA